MISCFVSFVHTPLSGSTLKKKTQEIEEHDVTVTLNLVQVYVTDKEGNPVTDLEKDDFEITDKGKHKPITDFEKQVLAVH